MDGSELIKRLQQMPLFEQLDEHALAEVAARVDSMHLPGGATLMREGDEADAVYMLVSGRLRAYVKQANGDMLAVGDVASGEVVGEMALLSDQPRSADVQAVRDSHLLRLGRDDFLDVVERHPTIVVETAKVIVGRLTRSIHGASTVANAKAIAVIPAGGGADVDAFTRGLAAELRKLVDVELVDRRRRDEQFGDGDPSRAEVTEWLNALEEAHGVVLYQAEPDLTEWTKRCLRQADRFLFVADHAASPELNVIERDFPNTVHDEAGAVRNLVLIHQPNVVLPSGTWRWLSEREGMTPRHIRLGNAGDYARLARGLAGKSVGIVLSGGGARGMAHVGVLRALEERGIAVDLVGGASFGSIVSGFHALGHDWRGVRERIKRFLVDQGSVLDLTAPASALTKGGKIGHELQAGFREIAIEDSWIPFFCTSSNLTAGRVEVHTRGRLRDAIRASISIPGVFPPMRNGDGDVLVDGGIMNNLPVDVMHKFGDGGPVIAVNLRGTVQMSSDDLAADGIVSGWRTLAERVNPFRPSPQMPGIVELLLRTTETGAALSSAALETTATVALHPPVSSFPLLDFSRLDQLVEAGYQYTKDRLATLDPEQMAALTGTA